MTDRHIGLDIGKTSFKAALGVRQNGSWGIEKTFYRQHQQDVHAIWETLRREWGITERDAVAVTGKLRRMLPFPTLTEKTAQEEAVRHLYPGEYPSVVRMGGSGFSVLKMSPDSPINTYAPNPRCASGTGSFLDQILARVGLDMEQADALACDGAAAEITSRCGVTMKTDFTHLLNSGEAKENVVAGLLDASAKNAAGLAVKTNGTAKRVLLIGGLSASRRIGRTLQAGLPPGVEVEVPSHARCFEALGAAYYASRKDTHAARRSRPSRARPNELTFLPSLKDSLDQVTIFPLTTEPPERPRPETGVVAGLDIGSTGAKLVVFDGKMACTAYTATQGQPVAAAQRLMQKIPPGLRAKLQAIGCTGSGRELVSSLFKSTLGDAGKERVFVLNEIAAHAAGAHYVDPGVDTVVDIGGQDAKFSRIENGRVVDSCMNTVCSAGTGSFLAEQFELLGIRDITRLGELALEAPRAVDLGQHCAVFMSEQLDAAQQQGVKVPELAAGLYYSIVRNYNNRVKGFREYGEKIFLQGKPAENPALAAALARISGKRIIVPPLPGCPGALGIALLAAREFGQGLADEKPLDVGAFLTSRIVRQRQFHCRSTEGCVTGNACRIQTLQVQTGDQRKTFFWGGACDKYEKNSRRNDTARPSYHPFSERENLIQKLFENNPDGVEPTVSIPRGLETEQILPLLTTFFQASGLAVHPPAPGGIGLLEDGGKLCQSACCAPIQILAGRAKASEGAHYIVLPKVIETKAPVHNEDRNRSFVCPLSQALPDMLSAKLKPRVLHPLLNFKNGYAGAFDAFVRMGSSLGLGRKDVSRAFSQALQAQEAFERNCRLIGQRAIAEAEEQSVPLIVLLGHPYVIHASLLLGSIPQAIQENGAVALPVSCYPLSGRLPVLANMNWGYGQHLLQAAWQIRRQPRTFPLWLSVYSCGPDSFLLHFFQYLAKGKPYAILESDAYTGQAGFQTRIESFLYAVKNYNGAGQAAGGNVDLRHFDTHEKMTDILASGRKVLIPWMGEHTRIGAAYLRSCGIPARALPPGDGRVLDLGRQYTSGKECLPMIITLGSLLRYLEQNEGEKVYFFMPQAAGPCRFGQYQRLFKIILERLGLGDTVSVVSPDPRMGRAYQMKLGVVSTARNWALFVLTDLLIEALLEVRPEEKAPGAAQKVFDAYLAEAEALAERSGGPWRNGNSLWGLVPLAVRAARAFREVERDQSKRDKPRVLVTGEIYVRANHFANNDLIAELEALGVKTMLSPIREWVNYVMWARIKQNYLGAVKRFKATMAIRFQRAIEQKLYRSFAKELGWGDDHSVEDVLARARPYLKDLFPTGEAALTIGGSLLSWDRGEIQGSVVTGPFECMPTRIAENQLEAASRKTGLPYLSVAFNGEPLDRDRLESFVLDLHKAAPPRLPVPVLACALRASRRQTGESGPTATCLL